MEFALAAAAILVFVVIYFVPVIVANVRHHRNENAIGMLNLLLGWTGLGWVIALIWASTDNCEPKVRTYADVANDLGSAKRHPKYDQWED
jgi:hypothetical protein